MEKWNDFDEHKHAETGAAFRASPQISVFIKFYVMTRGFPSLDVTVVSLSKVFGHELLH